MPFTKEDEGSECIYRLKNHCLWGTKARHNGFFHILIFKGSNILLVFTVENYAFPAICFRYYVFLQSHRKLLYVEYTCIGKVADICVCPQCPVHMHSRDNLNPAWIQVELDRYRKNIIINSIAYIGGCKIWTIWTYTYVYALTFSNVVQCSHWLVMLYCR